MEKVLLDKEYRLVQWLLERTGKYPREYRSSIAAHVNDLAFKLLDTTLLALASRSRRRLLASMSVTLDALRLYVRMSMDLKLISVKQYQYAAEAMNDVGKLLGGWIKKEA